MTSSSGDGSRPTTIIFLTDGLATEGITDTGLLLENVAAALPANARLFAFGVGDDRPRASNSTAAGRRLNQRVIVTFIPRYPVRS